MKKMRKGLGVLMAVVLMLAFAGQASAFCVYNNTTDQELMFQQTSGGKIFRGYDSGWLKPGESGCCHWQNKDCNKAGYLGSPVEFEVYYIENYASSRQKVVKICKDFQITAGGVLNVTGSSGKYTCSGQ